MRKLDLVQGSPEWLEARKGTFPASEAPAALGESKFTTRNELLLQKTTGVVKEVSAFQQAKFDEGHKAEEDARPLAEYFLCEILKPVVLVEDVDGMTLLASLDGQTEDGSINWECKLWNVQLVQDALSGNLSAHYWMQMEHQMIVSGARKTLFTVSNGTPEQTVHVMYESREDRRNQVIAGWKQFAKDLAAFTVVEPTEKLVAEHTVDLPAIYVQFQGNISVESNLEQFRSDLMTYVAKIPAQPKTDQEYAECEAAFKHAKAARALVKDAIATAIAKSGQVGITVKDLEGIDKILAKLQKDTEHQVTTRKDNMKAEAIAAGQTQIDDHVSELNRGPCRGYLPSVTGEFAKAIYGKKSFDKILEAINVEVSKSKIRASMQSANIQTNLSVLYAQDAGMEFLFRDVASLVLKEPEDFNAQIQIRIDDHKRREAAIAQAARDSMIAQAVTEAKVVQPAAPYIPAVFVEQSIPVQYPSMPTGIEILELIAHTYGLDEISALSLLKSIDFAELDLYCSVTS